MPTGARREAGAARRNARRVGHSGVRPCFVPEATSLVRPRAVDFCSCPGCCPSQTVLAVFLGILRKYCRPAAATTEISAPFLEFSRRAPRSADGLAREMGRAVACREFCDERPRYQADRHAAEMSPLIVARRATCNLQLARSENCGAEGGPANSMSRFFLRCNLL